MFNVKKNIFVNSIGDVLRCKRASFTTQKGTFYKANCNSLDIGRLQTQFLYFVFSSLMCYRRKFVLYFLKEYIYSCWYPKLIQVSSYLP